MPSWPRGVSFEQGCQRARIGDRLARSALLAVGVDCRDGELERGERESVGRELVEGGEAMEVGRVQHEHVPV